MGKFIFNNLEYVVGIAGALIAVALIKSRKLKGNKNDLTPLLLKHSKLKEAMSKKSKSILG